jgi:hypothetical protein
MAMPASAPARLPVRISPAPILVAVNRIAGPMADSVDFRNGDEFSIAANQKLDRTASGSDRLRPPGRYRFLFCFSMVKIFLHQPEYRRNQSMEICFVVNADLPHASL